MSNSVILPSMTDQMVLAIFKHLVSCELRKNLEGQHEWWFGNQEGFVAAVAIMFGETDDATAHEAYVKGGTWLQITEKIVEEELQDWAKGLSSLEKGETVDLEAVQQAIDKAVDTYALQHPKSLSDALRKNL